MSKINSITPENPDWGCALLCDYLGSMICFDWCGSICSGSLPASFYQCFNEHSCVGGTSSLVFNQVNNQ